MRAGARGEACHEGYNEEVQMDEDDNEGVPAPPPIALLVEQGHPKAPACRVRILDLIIEQVLKVRADRKGLHAPDDAVAVLAVRDRLNALRPPAGLSNCYAGLHSAKARAPVERRGSHRGRVGEYLRGLVLLQLIAEKRQAVGGHARGLAGRGIPARHVHTLSRPNTRPPVGIRILFLEPSSRKTLKSNFV